LVFQALPEFSNEARRKHVTGGVLVAFVVDQKGRPQNVNVVHGLASGLDEKGIESVRKSRFSPATVEGKAIAFPMNVEVNFKDY
jgi:TonB family protein